LQGYLEKETNLMSDRLKTLQGDEQLAEKIVAIHARGNGELCIEDADIRIMERFKEWEPRIVVSE
jgi:hypothetical protein